jgi:predicted  nucleic acid-binding Zn-ribbon protein
LNTRLEHFDTEIANLQANINSKKIEIEEARTKIERYEEQQKSVRNNREFDNLSKKLSFKLWRLNFDEKRIREFTAARENKIAEQQGTKDKLSERKLDLEQKKGELNEIVAETKQEEEKLREQAKQIENLIEPRLLTAFKRIRKNARNGLAVVYVQRDACGGCFNKIPAQRQLDIRLRKKIIVCEYCGRILVDQELAGAAATSSVE